MLVADCRFKTPFKSAVIIVSRYFLKGFFISFMLYPPVKIQDFRLVFIDELTCTDKPVIKKFLRRIRLGIYIFLISLLLGLRPVEIADLHRILDITVKILAVAHEP